MRRKKEPEEYEFLSIKLTSHEASVGESINVDLVSSVPRDLDDSYPVVTSDVRLSLAGTCTFPESRAGDFYEITLYGPRPGLGQLSFKDIRVRDKEGFLAYRTYRGGNYPVFKAPLGLSTVERRRGTRDWQTWHFASPETIARILSLMTFGRDLYVSIHERKVGRQRWVQGFSIQTTDPAIE